jgi:hypothetical protein
VAPYGGVPAVGAIEQVIARRTTILVTTGSLLVAFASILVTLEAIWTALALGTVGLWLILHSA